MFKAIPVYRALTRNAKNYQSVVKRTFLSESFDCKEFWNKRLESPIIKKINVADLYYELDNCFHQKGKATAIDVDVFANCVKDNAHLDEVEDIIHKFRLCSEAANILPSTNHALIRAFLSFGDSEELLRILNDRLNYGVFPDDFCSILMMDRFLKANNLRDASKIAVLQMLQEDFANPIIHYMSLYACHKYVLNPSEWETQEKDILPENNEDDEEEVRIRVKYIRNPYFDEHFDLKHSNDLLGKTFIIAGNLIDDNVGETYKLIGYCLFKKFDKAITCIENILKTGGSEKKLFKDGVAICKDYLSRAVNENTASSENSSDDQSSETNLLKSLLEKVESAGLVENGDLLGTTEKRLKTIISENEEKLITKQIQLYEEWENQREVLLNKAIEELKIKKRLEEVQRKKEELASKEEELFFFEKENELDLKIENKKVIYPKKWHGKKKKKRAESIEYVPPEITRQTVS